jgi:hypothetical protein
MVVTRAVCLVTASLLIGSLIVKLLAGLPNEPIAQAWRCRLVWTMGTLAGLFAVSALTALSIRGRTGLNSMVTAGRLTSALAVHGAAAGLWLGVLVPLGLLLYTASSGTAEDGRFALSASRRVSALALGFLVISLFGMTWAWALVGGVLGLVGRSRRPSAPSWRSGGSRPTRAPEASGSGVGSVRSPLQRPSSPPEWREWRIPPPSLRSEE